MSSALKKPLDTNLEPTCFLLPSPKERAVVRLYSYIRLVLEILIPSETKPLRTNIQYPL